MAPTTASAVGEDPDRTTDGRAAVVYKYGCPVGWDLPDAAIEQMRLANQLWNRLVELDVAYMDKYQEAWASVPAYAEAVEGVETAYKALTAVQEIAKAERRDGRTTRTRTETSEKLRQCRTELAAAKEVRKQAKSLLGEMVKARLATASAERASAQKALYPEFRQKGLFYDTINDVIRRHRVGAAQVIKQRGSGRGATLHFHAFRGEGTLTVQLKRTVGMPARGPELLASGGGPWRNQFQLAPWVDPEIWDSMTRKEQRQLTRIPPEEWAALSREERREIGHGYAMFNLGSTILRIPLIVSRMLPRGADVARVQVTRRMVAGRPEISVSVTALLESLEVGGGKGPGRPMAALHIGWRSLGAEGVRVGLLASTGVLPTTPPGLLFPAFFT